MARVGVKSSLNPHAKEFVPFQNAHAQPMSAAEADSRFPLLDLPPEMLACILSGVASRDAWQCLLVNRQLQSAVQGASLFFTLSDKQKHVLGNPAQSYLLEQLVNALVKYMPGTVSCNLSMLPLEHSHISTLASNLSQLQVLDLSGCKKLQPAITKTIMQPQVLQQLRCLNLQRCFQLTDACISDVLAMSSSADSTQDGIISGRRAVQCAAFSHINLACWPSTDSSRRSNRSTATDQQDGTVAVGTSETSIHNTDTPVNTFWDQLQQQVQALLLRLPKHLELDGFATAATDFSSSLRVVALNNCAMLSVSGLLSLAVACPQLEYLSLGGSTIKAVSLGTAGGSTAVGDGPYLPPAAQPAAVAGSEVSPAAGEPPALQQLAELLQLPLDLPWEALSSCCEHRAAHHAACDCSCPCCSGTAKQERTTRLLMARNQPSAAAIAAARSQALALAYAVALLPKLKEIEVTFMAPGVAGWLRQAIGRLEALRHNTQDSRSSGSVAGLSRCDSANSSCSSKDSYSSGTVRFSGSHSCSDMDSSSQGRSLVPMIWELSCVNAVHQALEVVKQLSTSSHVHRMTTETVSATESAKLHPSCLPTALRCAVNCSTRGRSTPLHAAAETGCTCHLRALLQAGAVVNARDGGGASPLFVAAEAGQASAVAVLLGAGADALVGNSAGETPLYIAALRGHLPVVQLLVEHLSAAGVDWMNGRLYGDAWTPLMAAAVANRVDVAMFLLKAATWHKTDSAAVSRAAPASSGVISQRYNSPWLQQRCGLDSSDGSWRSGAVQKFLAAENRYGQTVLHIAARKGCRELLQLLLCYGAGQVAGRLADAAGDTPLDIARRHGHQMVLHELLQRC